MQGLAAAWEPAASATAAVAEQRAPLLQASQAALQQPQPWSAAAGVLQQQQQQQQWRHYAKQHAPTGAYQQPREVARPGQVSH